MTQVKTGTGKVDLNLVLILSGGNALGAFQAGFYDALNDHGIAPDWIVGTSIGAINGALILGVPPEDRMANLRRFWDVPSGSDYAWPFGPSPWQRTLGANWAAIYGRPGLFDIATTGLANHAVYNTGGLRRTLDRQVDFDRLNGGPFHLTVNAVDLETGEDVIFDTSRGRIRSDHVRASAALPVLFPPVESGGRWLVDGGLSANLALDPFFQDLPPRRTLSIAVDLLPGAQALPRTLGEAGSRMQDLVFAAQSRRALERWTETYASYRGPGITFVRVAYANQRKEVFGKAMDFSRATIRDRWQERHGSATSLLNWIATGDLALVEEGLLVHQP